MAYSVTINNILFSLVLVFVCGFKLGKGDDYVPQIGAVGGGHEILPQAGYEGGDAGESGSDPAQVVTKALLCFNDKYIYSSCNEEYRLTQSGNINVPPQYVDQFCQGPCLTETHLVLSCIENILSHFLFFNEATIKDVRETIKDGCEYGPKRGNFNVAEHIRADEGTAIRMAFNSVLFGILVIILGLCTGYYK